MNPHSPPASFAPDTDARFSSIPNGTTISAAGGLPAVDMPDRVVHLRVDVLRRIGPQLLVIFIHRPRDHVEMHPLRRLRLLIHEIRQALRRRIGQPFVDGQAIALGFRDLLPLIIQEQLIGHMVRLAPAQHLANPVIDRGVGGMVLAIHLEVHIQRRPARAESPASTAASHCRPSPAASIRGPSRRQR